MTTPVREPFAHDAVLSMDAGSDVRAPGAAVTVALCGHWDHEPPCALAPHHTGVDQDGSDVRLRILFSTEPEREGAVRRAIDEALAAGGLAGPDGATTRWKLHSSNPSEVRADEREHAGRLARHQGG